ncbi:MAG TPA: hypothetical protein VKP88_00675, partial [Candidatus Paceibacterota bacterium]|nr:hypothetical protein [Candidatus Paceibacterota bacterium]
MKFKSALAASLLLAGTAQAAVIMNMLEVGSDVIISGSGSINITGFSSTLAPPNSGTSFIPSQGVVSNRTLVDWRQTYNGVGLTGPTNF